MGAKRTVNIGPCECCKQSGPCEEECCLGDFCDPSVYADDDFPITGQAVSGPGQTAEYWWDPGSPYYREHCSYLYMCPGISGLSGSTVYRCKCHDRCFQVSWSDGGWDTSSSGGGPFGCADQDVVDFVVELIPCP